VTLSLDFYAGLDTRASVGTEVKVVWRV